jgi:hypothetical protein
MGHGKRDEQITIRVTLKEYNYCEEKSLQYGSRSAYLRHLIQQDMNPVKNDVSLLDKDVLKEAINQVLLSMTSTERNILLEKAAPVSTKNMLEPIDEAEKSSKEDTEMSESVKRIINFDFG